MSKTYDELITFKTFNERLNYLKQEGVPGRETFGVLRWLNQHFYTSWDWKQIRPDIIVRDKGCDLGMDGFEIVNESIIIHHIEPVTVEDIVNRSPKLMDPQNLICTTTLTHKAIHYNNVIVNYEPIERQPFDTCPWRR